MNRIIALAAAGVTTLAMAAHCQPDAAPADTTIRVNGNIEVAVAGSDSTITIYENWATHGRRPILTVQRDVDLDAEASDGRRPILTVQRDVDLDAEASDGRFVISGDLNALGDALKRWVERGAAGLEKLGRSLEEIFDPEALEELGEELGNVVTIGDVEIDVDDPDITTNTEWLNAFQRHRTAYERAAAAKLSSSMTRQATAIVELCKADKAKHLLTAHERKLCVDVIKQLKKKGSDKLANGLLDEAMNYLK